ncbi:MAG: ATP-dependent Clp protease adaptor ClpS [Sphingobacteriaceae bacterium]|nr:ATP-dependent Clp protease adaptor ClpS [Sphingobacteriaceae bacterium]
MNLFDTEIQEQEDVLVVEQKQRALVVYNDDFNTFDFVIETLMKYCGHEPEQAVQCTYLIHYKGQCAVKNGSYKQLKPICEAILEKGLTAKIEYAS